MKEQKTAEQILESKVPPALYKRGDCYVGHALDAMQAYSDQQNAELREKIAKLSKILSNLVEQEELRYKGEYNAACAHNNTDGVGIYFDYQPYPQLPDWIKKAKEELK